MNGKVIDVYLHKESEEFVPSCAVRDCGERLLGYVLLMLLYTGLLHIIPLNLFVVAFEMPGFQHFYVYLREGKPW